MKKIEEIVDIWTTNTRFDAEAKAIAPEVIDGKLNQTSFIEFATGYRTAEAEYSEAIRELTKELEDARDDVEHCLNMDTIKRPANTRAIEAGQAQLARIDALLAKYKEQNRG